MGIKLMPWNKLRGGRGNTTLKRQGCLRNTKEFPLLSKESSPTVSLWSATNLWGTSQRNTTLPKIWRPESLVKWKRMATTFFVIQMRRRTTNLRWSCLITSLWQTQRRLGNSNTWPGESLKWSDITNSTKQRSLTNSTLQSCNYFILSTTRRSFTLMMSRLANSSTWEMRNRLSTSEERSCPLQRKWWLEEKWQRQ